LGPTGIAYVVVVFAMIVTSLIFVRRPFAVLVITAVFLATANPALLGEKTTAGAAAILIVILMLGTLLYGNPRRRLAESQDGLPIILASLAIWGVLDGFTRGNRPVLIAGDLYQLFEFILLFFLARRLVTTEDRFRTIAMVVVGAIVATSMVQIIDVAFGS